MPTTNPETNNDRPVDKIAEQIINYTEKNLISVSKKEIKMWQVIFVLAIMLGGAVSLIWSTSSGISSTSEAAIRTNIVKQPCKDSDGGQNYFVKGTSTGLDAYGGNSKTQATYTDKCDSSARLMEFYCYNVSGKGYVTMSNVSCEFGCTDGACLTSPSATSTPTSCFDGDNGRDYYTKATTTGPDGIGGNLSKIAKYQDQCDSTGKLKEYYCYQGTSSTSSYISMETISCQNGCSNGACIQSSPTSSISCLDSDNGVNRTVAGTCKDSIGNYADSCTVGPNGEPMIKEYYCSQNKCYSTEYNCKAYGFSTCSAGSCMNTSTTTATSSPK